MLGLSVFERLPVLGTLHMADAAHGIVGILLSLLIIFSSCFIAFYMLHSQQDATVKSYRFSTVLCAAVVICMGIGSALFVGMLFTQWTLPVYYAAWIIATFILFSLFAAAVAIFILHNRWSAIEASHKQLQAMVETAQAAFICTDSRGLILNYTPAAHRLFGYSKEEVLGRSINMLMPSPLAEQHDVLLLEHLKHISKSIPNKLREVLGHHKDGKLIPLQLSLGKAITPEGLIFIGYLQDISERKRADAHLRIAASVFHHAHEGVAIIDAHHNITDVNPSFERLMEMSKQDCMGKSLIDLYENVDIPPDMSGLWNSLVTKQHWQTEVMLTRSNGQVWMQRISITPVFNELQRPHHFIAVISDISERPSLDVMLPQDELHDSNTGLATRKLFLDRLTCQLISSHRKFTNVGVMCIHLEMHSSASTHDLDSALRLLTQMLAKQLRCTDTLARYQKDLLAIMLPGIKDVASFEALIERLSQSMQDLHPHYAPLNLQTLRISHISTLQGQFSTRDLMDAVIHSAPHRAIAIRNNASVMC